MKSRGSCTKEGNRSAGFETRNPTPSALAIQILISGHDHLDHINKFLSVRGSSFVSFHYPPPPLFFHCHKRMFFMLKVAYIDSNYVHEWGVL